jgi:aspartate-semialdehyde dehydrogenase
MTRVAILEPQSLLGTEVRDSLRALPTPLTEVRLLTRDLDSEGLLTEVQGSAAVVQTRRPGCLDGMDLVFACGEPGDEEAFAEDMPEGATLLLVGAGVPPASAEPLVAGVSVPATEAGGVLASPHPAVVLLAHVLAPLRELDLEEATAHVTLPGSLRGKVGMDEILEQVKSILSFSGETFEDVYGTQIAFNLIPSTLPASVLLDQLGRVLTRGHDSPAPLLSLRLSQAGVFHGVTAQILVRLKGATSAAGLRETLESQTFVSSADEPDLLGPKDVAGGDDVLLGRIDPADDTGRRWWITAVMDNLTRGGALNALGVAESIL